MDISKSEIYSILSSVQMLSRKDYQAIHRDPNKVTKYFIIWCFMHLFYLFFFFIWTYFIALILQSKDK